MSNTFGEFWYVPTIDKDGFDIHDENGIVDWEATSEKAIMNCQRRYIQALEEESSSKSDTYEFLQQKIARRNVEIYRLKELLGQGIGIVKSRGFLIIDHEKWVDRAWAALNAYPSAAAPDSGWLDTKIQEEENNE